MRRTAASHRRMTLLDGLILVAAVGVMFWMGRSHFEREALPPPIRSFDDLSDATHWVADLLPCAVVWTMAVLLLALRRPRPPLRRMVNEPGFAACLTASVIVLIGVPIGVASESLVYVGAGHPVAEIDWAAVNLYTLGNLPSMISIAIAAAWIVQCVCGRWRSRSTWIDRLGRATGCFWIPLIPIHELNSVGCLGG
jgi:hypothetical protein